MNFSDYLRGSDCLCIFLSWHFAKATLAHVLFSSGRFA